MDKGKQTYKTKARELIIGYLKEHKDKRFTAREIYASVCEQENVTGLRSTGIWTGCVSRAACSALRNRIRMHGSISTRRSMNTVTRICMPSAVSAERYFISRIRLWMNLRISCIPSTDWISTHPNPSL